MMPYANIFYPKNASYGCYRYRLVKSFHNLALYKRSADEKVMWVVFDIPRRKRLGKALFKGCVPHSNEEHVFYTLFLADMKFSELKTTKFSIYTRICRRCKRPFVTKKKGSRVCIECDKSSKKVTKKFFVRYLEK